MNIVHGFFVAFGTDVLKVRSAIAFECFVLFCAFAVAAFGPALLATTGSCLDLVVTGFAVVVAFGLVASLLAWRRRSDTRRAAWEEGLALALVLLGLNGVGWLRGVTTWSWYVAIAVGLIVLDLLGTNVVNRFEKTVIGLDALQIGPRAPVPRDTSRLRQFMLAPEEMPWLLLTGPALLVVIMASWWDTSQLRCLELFALIVFAALIGMMHLNREKKLWLRQYLKRITSEGFSKYLSITVVLLASLRLLDVDQVTILLRDSSFSIQLQLIASAYFIVLLVDGFRGRSLGRYLIHRLTKSGKQTEEFASGDLKIDGEPVFQWELLGRLSAPGDGKQDVKQQFQNSINARRVAGDWALVIAVAVVILLGSSTTWLDAPPVVAVDGASDRQGESLGDLLKKKTNPIVIAASGGGTRAALFTHAVLRGLAEHGQIDRVVLLSGVSGGSLAIAAFLAQRDLLSLNDPAAWKDHLDVVAHAYIEDVLVRATALPWPPWWLSHHLGAAMTARLGEKRLGNFNDIGIVINTTIAGSERQVTNRCAGGRLVFTNLAEPVFGSQTECSDDDTQIPYVALRDPQTRLAEAAALSANFPPVFPDALVDLRSTRASVYVTDGGVLDNRGVLSTLRALLSLANGSGGALDSVTVLVLEASAISKPYAAGRGLQALEETHSKLATALVEFLERELSDVKVKYQVKDVTMPDVLRRDMTTHFKVPEELKLRCEEGLVTVSRDDLLPAISTMFLKEPHRAQVDPRLAKCLGLTERCQALLSAISASQDCDAVSHNRGGVKGTE